jgi:isocitrate dehydrogenase (NAD+)
MPAWWRSRSTANCCRRHHGLDPRNRIALKSPLTTPVGEGFQLDQRRAAQSASTSTPTVRPAKSFPEQPSRASRTGRGPDHRPENTEGAYIGEGQSLSRTARPRCCTQKVTAAGSERIVRYAFDPARSDGRKKVTVVHKANILKSTSGLFLRWRAKWPRNIRKSVQRDDRGQHLHATGDAPEQFDIIVTTNLFGDIISDLCARLSAGLAWRRRQHRHEAAIFEAVHGSAPDIAGKGIANPCALLLGGGRCSTHLGQPQDAERLRKAIVATLEARDSLTPGSGRRGQYDVVREGNRPAASEPSAPGGSH